MVLQLKYMDIKPRNETARIALTNILVGEEIDRYESDRQLWAYQEDGVWNLVSNCFIERSYSLLGSICSHRAIEVESGEVVVNGKPTKAEDYIALWRKTGEAAMLFSEFIAQGGTLTVTVKRQLALFEKKAAKGTELQKTLLQNATCVVGPTVTWVVSLHAIAGIKTYFAINNVYCKDESQPGEDSQLFALTMPTQAPFKSLTTSTSVTTDSSQETSNVQ